MNTVFTVIFNFQVYMSVKLLSSSVNYSNQVPSSNRKNALGAVSIPDDQIVNCHFSVTKT